MTEPAGLSTFATIGLLILAIGGLAAVSAWLWAWYQARAGSRGRCRTSRPDPR